MRKRLIALTAVAMLALGIAGCGGDDGDTGPQGPAGAPGAPGPAGPPGVGPGAAVNVGDLTADQWAALSINGEITSVTIASPPVVAFKLTDAAGKPIVGIGKNTSTSNGVTTYSNIRFTMAKLVPGANKGSDHWVNYIVTSNTGAPSRPSTDQNGTLVDNGDGTYTYTFARDVMTMAGTVAAATVPAGSDKADLGDLSWAPDLQHRVVMQISGNNLGVALENPANVSYDWVPATGAKIAKADQQKYVVDISSCNTCHDKLAIHGGGRIDTQYCTTCHTTQRAYGRPEVTSVAGAFPALTETKTVNATTGITSYTYESAGQPSADPYIFVGDGEVMGNFVTMVHKIHQGTSLSKANYNYEDRVFDKKGFSMLGDGQRMCTVCHDATVAPKAELAYSKPTREACGACHDNVNFATGANHSPSNIARVDDSSCDICHSAAQTRVDHRTVNLTEHNQSVTDGLANFTYEIKEAKVDPATNDLTIEFRIQQAIAPSTTPTAVTFVAPVTTLVPGMVGTTPTDLCLTNALAGYTGAPGFLLAFAVGQDNITAPADYNNSGNGQANAQPWSISIASLLNGYSAGQCPATSATANPTDAPNPGFANGKLEAAATAGYYVATIYGAGAWKMPADAKMRTVALQGYFTQVSPAAARHTISVVKTVTGDTPRRKVVDARNCASCHEWFEGHGGNRVIGVETKDGELVCMACHVPNMTSSGHTMPDVEWNLKVAGGSYTPVGLKPIRITAWTADQLFMLGEWGVDINVATNGALQMPVTSNNMKDMIHGIHAGRDRVAPWKDARYFRNSQTMLDFRRLDFPGTLGNCENCHIANTYGTVPANALMSNHYFRSDVSTPEAAATSMKAISPLDTVITPFAAACVSCHDHPSAQGHMQTQGAYVNATRATVVGNASIEACQTCHGAGAEWDVAKVHK